MEGMEMNFGEYIESIRKARRKSLRETARAIGVSAPYFSDVERGRRCAFTAERLEALKVFLEMSPKEANDMYDKAAKSYSSKGDNVAVPQDFTSYIVDNSYVVAALRTLKEGGQMNRIGRTWCRLFLIIKLRKQAQTVVLKRTNTTHRAKIKEENSAQVAFEM